MVKRLMLFVAVACVAFTVEAEVSSTGQAKLGFPDSQEAERLPGAWIFPGALDGHARMLNVGLSPQLCLSYDTARGVVYGFWRGRFIPEGKNNRAEGLFYIRDDGVAPWLCVSKKDGIQTCQVSYAGYEWKENRVTVKWRLKDRAGREVRISEVPESMAEPVTGLARQLTVSGLPEGITLLHRLAAPHSAMTWFSDGLIRKVEKDEEVLKAGFYLEQRENGTVVILARDEVGK